MEEITCQVMSEADIDTVVPFFIEHDNNYENCQWTKETAYKRIHQFWNKEDSLCFVLKRNGEIIGFVTGFLEQYHDLLAYDLWEILISHEFQGQGYGTRFMQMVEENVKEAGASMIQLIAVNDEAHDRFYGKLGFGNSTNLILKNKFL